MKKTLRNIGIFVLGVVATILITKMGDRVIPNDNNVVVDTIKDTIFVIEVNRPEPQEVTLEDDTEKLTQEMKYWKNVANRSSYRLNKIENKLDELANKNTKQPFVSTEKSVKDNNEIENLKKEIEKLKKNKSSTEFIADKGLNQVITNIKSYFPKKNAYSYSGTTNLLELDCPDFKNDEKYVDVDFLIKDKSLLNDVGAIFVSMTEIDDKGQHYYVYETYYKPQFGYNHLRVRNVKNRKRTKYKFHYGLMLKEDSEKEAPRIHGINCTFYK